MAVLQEYKCPCCGGAIEFNSTLQKMKCPYCDTEFELEALEGFAEDLKSEQPDEISWQPAAGTPWQEGEADAMRSFVCYSCGGEIVGDANTGATACPYCGNPVVMTDAFAGMLRPDLVIPFKLDKAAAKAGLLKHLKGKRLLPKVFKDENHIDEVKGIYVPYWLFDAGAEADLRFRGTRTRHWHDSSYDYTETSYYSILRAGSLQFAGVPVDGSSKMPDDLMESLEPYDLSEAVGFNTAYLAGYLADKYDVTAEQSEPRANERIHTSTIEGFRGTIHGYDSLMPEYCSVRLQGGRPRYALYPVWLMNTTWKGQKYTFAMNGQTGKFVGNLPEDKALGCKLALGVMAIGTAAIFGLQYLLWLL